MAGVPETENPLHLLAWQNASLLLAGEPDPVAQITLQQYLKTLSGNGLERNIQGVWLQSGPLLLANNQGTTPFPAASLTKVATSLAALQTWGPNHQFETQIRATGSVQKGVLQGDLVVQGGEDPLMVWEEAIALGNALNHMGITKVSGDLVIAGDFLMNFEADPLKAGAFFKQALDSQQWPEEVEAQYKTLPKGTPRPQVAIVGSVKVLASGNTLPGQRELLRHHSLPLVQIIKLMNVYSNNEIAESLATSLGGAPVVAQRAAQAAGVPTPEIQLKNGSGLGVENQISPRAVCAMFEVLQSYAQAHHLTLADLFPVAGSDKGTIDYRKIPKASVVKTGTLNNVSALAGVMPTRDRGLVWFAIINRGADVDKLREQQDKLLQALVKQWGTVSPPVTLTPSSKTQSAASLLGDHSRIEMVRSAVELYTF